MVDVDGILGVVARGGGSTFCNARQPIKRSRTPAVPCRARTILASSTTDPRGCSTAPQLTWGTFYQGYLQGRTTRNSQEVPPSLKISVVHGFDLNPPQVTWVSATLCPKANADQLPGDCYSLALKRHVTQFDHVKRHSWFLPGFLRSAHSVKLLKSCSRRKGTAELSDAISAGTG